MNYQEAKQIRGKSYISGITEKLIAGHGLGSSVVKTISEKSKARNVGFKEKFDPLNIVKFMTGGSKLAPALLGRLTNRSDTDIAHFTQETGKKKLKKIKHSILTELDQAAVMEALGFHVSEESTIITDENGGLFVLQQGFQELESSTEE